MKLRAYIDVQLGLMSNVDDNISKCLGFGHSASLEGSQSMCTCVGLQEQVVLLHVVDETLFGQGSISDALDKGMLGVLLPVVLACLKEVSGQRVRVITRWPIFERKRKGVSTCWRYISYIMTRNKLTRRVGSAE